MVIIRAAVLKPECTRECGEGGSKNSHWALSLWVCGSGVGSESLHCTPSRAEALMLKLGSTFQHECVRRLS